MSARTLAILALVLTGPAIAQTPAQAPAPTPSQARNDPNRVICRRESVTGSLAQTRKVCMTRADWIARTRDAQAVGQEMQDKSLINSCSSPDRSGC